MRRWFPIPAVYFALVLVFPAVRWWRHPDDALTRCPPARWRIDDHGVLACDRAWPRPGHGRPLRPLERLSLRLPVDVHDLSEADWRALVGRTLTGRLGQRRARLGFLCRRRISELADELADEVLARLPPTLTCGNPSVGRAR